MLTEYHAKYYAYELTRSGGRGLDRLSQSLFNATVDLNPHQVEAALFALRSPLSKGVLLADEVGLGKTIEAGLVLCQYWAERKRKLLVVCPASLRKQWQVELEEKFNLPSRVMDSKIYRRDRKAGVVNPFDRDEVIITSIHYASRMAEDIRQVQWDLVIMDEAHKLRNSYRASSKLGQNIRWALEDRKKVLLTATPLQNSLTEIYGITTLIDEKLFGDLPTFRTLYTKSDGDLDDLRARLSGFCLRTLRKDVLEFIRYTERKLTTIRFQPTDEEHRLYEAVSAFLQREGTYALPKQQKHLTVIVVRKVLASSSVALAGTLEVIKNRLIAMRDQATDQRDITARLLSKDDLDEELIEELLEEIAEEAVDEQRVEDSDEVVINRSQLEEEIEEVDKYIRWARSVGIDTKTRHLLQALELGYEKMAEVGAARKAVIFTESRRTQDYLRDFLETNGYAGKVATFSGTNRDQRSKEIYESWLQENRHSGQVSGSRAVDLRHAIIDHFRNDAQILIATEAAAEGINLQFCSLLINFDLPWNPQRVEQRIGRVHRYGQKHDVVVINFLNERNAADQRVYDLLQHKFHLFEGIFGASDDVLGQLDSSAGFEARIMDLYQQCRTEEEIEEGFQKLKKELDQQIQLRMADTRDKLLKHFDEGVHSLLKVDYDEALLKLDTVGRQFWCLTKVVLGDRAEFDDEDLSFMLEQSPVHEVLTGRYYMNRKRNIHTPEGAVDKLENISIYRLSHPLGEYCIDTAKDMELPAASIQFDLSGYGSKISMLEPLQHKSGWLVLNLLEIQSLEKEEHLLFSCITDDGSNIDHEVAEQFFKLEGLVGGVASPPDEVSQRLASDGNRYADATIHRSLEHNNSHFQERREQLFRWSDDVVAAAERELKQVKAELRAAEREAALAQTVEEQKEAQEKIRTMEARKRAARRKIFDVEDEIEGKRDVLIQALEKKMVQETSLKPLFMFKWTIV